MSGKKIGGLVEIRDYYKLTEKVKTHNPNYKHHLIDLNFRMGVIAQSGGGKTQFIMELIHRFSNTFEEIIVCLRNRAEPLYDLLAKLGGEQVKFYENEVPDIDLFKDKISRFVIFDDLINSKSLNENIKEYMLRGRKYNLSMAYLSQSFYAIPKFIRQQFNYLVIKKIGSDKDFKMIIREYSLGISIDDLFNLYKECTKDKLHFLLLDLQNDSMKYRYCFQPISV